MVTATVSRSALPMFAFLMALEVTMPMANTTIRARAATMAMEKTFSFLASFCSARWRSVSWLSCSALRSFFLLDALIGYHFLSLDVACASY